MLLSTLCFAFALSAFICRAQIPRPSFSSIPPAALLQDGLVCGFKRVCSFHLVRTGIVLGAPTSALNSYTSWHIIHRIAGVVWVARAWFQVGMGTLMNIAVPRSYNVKTKGVHVCLCVPFCLESQWIVGLATQTCTPRHAPTHPHLHTLMYTHPFNYLLTSHTCTHMHPHMHTHTHALTPFFSVRTNHTNWRLTGVKWSRLLEHCQSWRISIKLDWGKWMMD